MRIKRTLILLVMLTVLAVSLFPVPALAIAYPVNPTIIRSTYVYHHCLETNDQLYFIDYFIEYAAIPTETVTEAFVVTLIDTDGVTQLKSVAPFTFIWTGYAHKGYNRGMVAIYFTAAEAAALTWGAAYTIRIAGNPLLAWPGAPPSTTAAIDYWSSSSGIGTTQTELSSQILYLAQALTPIWSLSMTQELASGTLLDAPGESYFGGVIQNLRSMAPYAFSVSITEPEFEDRVPTNAWAVTLSALTNNTPLDLTNSATAIGMSRTWLATGLFFAVLLTFLFFVVKYRGIKLVLPISGVSIIAAGMMGFIPLALTVGIGVLALIISGFLLFYRPSSA